MMCCKRFYDSSLDNYDCQTEIQKRLIATLKKCIDSGFNENILIIGGVGTGKTHLAYAILNTLEKKIKSEYSSLEWYSESRVIYRPIKKIIDDIRQSWSDNSGDSLADINKYKNCELLIIDEIGVQYGTDSERTELYGIFNHRYENCLPIVAISNNSLQELQRILGQRIYDRLTGGALIFELSGRSHRQEKNIQY